VGRNWSRVPGAIPSRHRWAPVTRLNPGPRSADNCILRRLELDASGRGQGFVDAFAGVPTAGFHTYGETWLGHVNQTLTGVIFG